MRDEPLLLSTNVQKGKFPNRVEELMEIIKVSIYNGITHGNLEVANSYPHFWCFQELTPTLIEEIQELTLGTNYTLLCNSGEGIGLLVNTLKYNIVDTYFVSPDYLSEKYFKNERNQKGYRVALLTPNSDENYKYYIVASYHGPHDINISLRKKFDKTLFDSIEDFIVQHNINKDEVCCIIAGDGNHLCRKELPSLNKLLLGYGYKHVNEGVGRTFIYNKVDIQITRIILYILRLKFVKYLFRRMNLHLDTVFVRDTKNIFNYKSEKVFPSVSDHYTILTCLE